MSRWLATGVSCAALMFPAHVAAADRPLSCFVVTPALSSTGGSRTFTLYNGCSVKVVEIDWKLAAIRSDGERENRCLTETFAMLPDDPQAQGSGLARHYGPGVSREVVLDMGEARGATGFRANSVELTIMALGSRTVRSLAAKTAKSAFANCGAHRSR